jgi:hypothetical protein
MKLPLPCAVLLSIIPALLGGQTMECRQWRTVELVFQAQDTHAQDPLGVRFGARFTGPDGSAYEVPGFWDGGQTWKLRFAPTVPGGWSYETTCTEVESRVFENLYKGETMRGNEPAERVDVPLDGAGELVLIVRDGGDGTNYDHADWADAQLVKKDGSVVYLDDLTPKQTSQGHGKLSLRRNIPGNPLRIADKTYERGLGTHAPGRTIYELDGSEARFRAWVGVDATVHEHGTVAFSVATSRQDASRVGRHDAGLHGKRGTFTALPANGDNPLHRHGGILRTSADGHSLTYADGTPFFWLGDTWWFCPSDLVPIDSSTNPEIPSAYKDMVQVRKRQGYTTVHMAFLGTIDGVNPYHESLSGPSLNPAYWQKVDRYMDYANENGLVPILGMGWAGRPLSTADWQILWRHLIARYGSHAVTFLVCGEYNVRGTDEIVDQTMDLAGYIKRTDPYHRAMTIHPWYYGADKRQAWDKPWYDFIMFQGGHGEPPSLDIYLQSYRRTPTKPVIEGECQYEGIGKFTDDDVRNVAYRAMQSGCCGFTYGSQGLWYPTQNTEDKRNEKWGKPLVWWKAVRRPGAEQLGHMRRIYETVDWWALKPANDMVVPPSDTAGAEVVCDLLDSFREAKATNAHWAKPSDPDPDCIGLHPVGTGEAVLAYPPIALPQVAPGESLKLVTAAGISRIANLADANNSSDGVHLAVRIDGKEAFREHRTDKAWSYHAVDLTAKAGNTVTIQLVTWAGDNMNWDHAIFRHPVIVKVKAEDETPCRAAFTSPPPRNVLAKASGDGTAILYFPAQAGPAARQLRSAAPGTKYLATWYDPRTGEPLPPLELAEAAGRISVPAPPDEQDWVMVIKKQ